jgi:hypothetical protein
MSDLNKQHPAGGSVKLDLGCGPHKKGPEWTGADRLAFPGVDVVIDLAKDDWPWPDDSVEDVFSSHFVEHLDAVQRVKFFNRLWRVLKAGAKAQIIAPHWSSCRAYGDPTHAWPPMNEFGLFYLNRKWRMENAPHTDIEHWPQGYSCNFDVTWGYGLSPDILTRNQEYQAFAVAHYKEAALDLIATVVAVKP